jgi:hypothetical protein
MFAFLKKRRIGWLLASIAVLLIAGSALLYWYSRVSLADFVDQDLRKLDDTPRTALAKVLHHFMPEQFPGPRTKLDRLLEKVLPPKDPEMPPVFWRFQPWYVWRLKQTTGLGFVLLEGQMLFSIPGSARLRIHFLDIDGSHIRVFEFWTGNRVSIHDAVFMEHDFLQVPVIEIKTHGWFEGGGRQFYAVLRDRVTLLRFEGEAGKPVANSYHNMRPNIGPEPPNRTKQEWVDLLQSTDSCHVLEALVWIGGYHWNGFGEPPIRLDLIEGVRTNPIVQKRIGELTRSDNQWIREAAQLAREQLPKKAQNTPPPK